MESKLQTEIIKWLKMNAVYVVKTRPGMGTPTGCPDIIGLWRDRWLVVEVKASEAAVFRPGQRETLRLMREANPFVYVAYPENWVDIKADLVARFFQIANA